MKSEDIPPLPALDDFCFAPDIDLALAVSVGDNHNTVNVNDNTVAAKTGQKRSSSLISEDESQSSASKEATYSELIDKAEAEERIDTKKAGRLRACLHSEDIIRSLLTEQIPDKRKGRGFYSCRICQVPTKGHLCPYCPVCSTPTTKFSKNDSHVCINCVKCFDEGKKRKKLVQCLKQKCPCSSKGKGSKVGHTKS
eukprot:scaffold688_cov138-Skeletonema_dohrnii-CCMP3373.AAC.5